MLCLGERGCILVAKFGQQELREIRGLFFLGWRRRKDFAIGTEQVGATELESPEELACGFVVDGVVGESTHDLDDAGLDRSRVLGDREAEALGAGHAVAFVEKVVKMAVFLIAHGRLAALHAVEFHVHALICAEGALTGFWYDFDHKFLSVTSK